MVMDWPTGSTGLEYGRARGGRPSKPCPGAQLCAVWLGRWMKQNVSSRKNTGTWGRCTSSTTRRTSRVLVDGQLPSEPLLQHNPQPLPGTTRRANHIEALLHIQQQHPPMAIRRVRAHAAVPRLPTAQMLPADQRPGHPASALFRSHPAQPAVEAPRAVPKAQLEADHALAVQGEDPQASRTWPKRSCRFTGSLLGKTCAARAKMPWASLASGTPRISTKCREESRPERRESVGMHQAYNTPRRS